MQVISLDQIRRIIDCHEPQPPRSVEPDTAKLFAEITDASHCNSQDISDALRCKVVNLFSSGHQQVSTQIKEL